MLESKISMSFPRDYYLECAEEFEANRIDCVDQELSEFNHDEEDLACELAYTRYTLAREELELEHLRAQVAELEDQKEAVIQQAQIWRQEARTMQNTVAECYQAVTGKTGEPGDWNGANPVRECIENLRAENARLSGRFTFTDEQAASVARAFWRRIQPYVYAEREAPYPKEFGAEIPVEFQAHMGTALLALHLHRKPDSEAG